MFYIYLKEYFSRAIYSLADNSETKTLLEHTGPVTPNPTPRPTRHPRTHAYMYIHMHMSLCSKTM